jgi:DNA-binding transcriptional LysR family regulator
VATATVAEFVFGPLIEAFAKRHATALEISSGVAATKEMPVLVAGRLADIAIGSAPLAHCGDAPHPPAALTRGGTPLAGGHSRTPDGPHPPVDPPLPVVTEPIFKYRLVVVTAGHARPRGGARQWRWLVDPSATDPGSDVSGVLAALRIPDDRIGVCSSQTAAWAAAADGGGVSLAVEHLVAQQLRRGELSMVDLPGLPMDGCWCVTMLEREQRRAVASSLRRFLSTPEAMQLMRSPSAGVPPSRFRPPVYVTIWS